MAVLFIDKRTAITEADRHLHSKRTSISMATKKALTMVISLALNQQEMLFLLAFLLSELKHI